MKIIKKRETEQLLAWKWYPTALRNLLALLLQCGASFPSGILQQPNLFSAIFALRNNRQFPPKCSEITSDHGNESSDLIASRAVIENPSQSIFIVRPAGANVRFHSNQTGNRHQHHGVAPISDASDSWRYYANNRHGQRQRRISQSTRVTRPPQIT